MIHFGDDDGRQTQRNGRAHDERERDETRGDHGLMSGEPVLGDFGGEAKRHGIRDPDQGLTHDGHPVLDLLGNEAVDAGTSGDEPEESARENESAGDVDEEPQAELLDEIRRREANRQPERESDGRQQIDSGRRRFVITLN